MELSLRIKIILTIASLFLIFFATWLIYTDKDNKILISKNDVFSVINEKESTKVKRVIDGDTIELENGEKVRYIGINAPEIGGEVDTEECFAQESLNKNKELVEGKTIFLEKDLSDKDKYGRLLRYVYLEDETFVNFVLVEKGYAQSVSYPPDLKYQSILNNAEEKAEKNKFGLWGACLK